MLILDPILKLLSNKRLTLNPLSHSFVLLILSFLFTYSLKLNSIQALSKTEFEPDLGAKPISLCLTTHTVLRAVLLLSFLPPQSYFNNA